VDGYRDVVAESVIVQDVDTKEENDVDHPSAERDLVWRNKEGGVSPVELRNVACYGDEEKLSKCHERSCTDINYCRKSSMTG
jgi:hypothetical protein